LSRVNSTVDGGFLMATHPDRRVLALALAATVAMVVNVQVAALARAPQVAGLKIVVIEGENAVNIIQQKSAVAPLIEVRDRNDLPVAGVPVSFTIAGPNATFGGGLQTISVTTNAAGRAVAAAVTPLRSGAVRFDIAASSQGQTVTATVTQANFATVAAAAGAGVVVAAGAGAAAGGGLSGLAIAGIIGGGAAAAGVVGLKAISGAKPCRLMIGGESSFAVPSFGGQQQVFPGIRPETCAQTWTATSNHAFLVVRQTTPHVAFEIAPNDIGSPGRTGTITVAAESQTLAVTVTQTTRCVFTVSISTISFPRNGGTATANIAAAPAGCDNGSWFTSTGAPDWVTFNPATGSGSGTVVVTVQPNTNPFPRGVGMFIALEHYDIVQAGPPD
jgi:hypothetical protein